MANYLLKNVDDDLWQAAKLQAMIEGRSMRELLIEFLTAYVLFANPNGYKKLEDIP